MSDPESADATVPAATAGGDDGAPSTGARIGRFVTVGTLGTGGMGVVLEAHDPELDRTVAIKLLRPELWRTVDGARGDHRLAREAQAMAKLSHPNVVAVYEVGRLGDRTFIAMERVDGETLRAWTRTPHPWREVTRMFVAAGRGLAAAHALGLVHRDVKPDNVLVGRDGRPRVTDFGLVAGAAARVSADTPLTVSLTVDDAVVGTPAYMSPEHWTGSGLDARSDQFSFAVALWEALYGARPFVAPSAPLIRAQVIAGKIAPPPADRDVPRRIEVALRRGLSAEPDARWPTLAALLDELEAAAAPRRVPWWLYAAGTAAVVAVIVFAFTRSHAPAPSCAASGDPMRATWTAEARAAVHDALAAVATPYAGEVADRVATRLDDYAADWTRSSLDACEATTIRGQQSPALLDRRVACLASRRRQLVALIGTFTDHPDVTTLDAAIKAATALDPIGDCDDADRLLAAVAPPDDDQRERADALGGSVADVRARFVTGHYDDGWKQLEPLLDPLRGLGYPPLTADALLIGGDLERERGELERALALLDEAATQGALARDDVRLAHAQLAIYQIVGDKQRRFPEASLLAPLADAQITRAGDPGGLRAHFLMVEGSIENDDSKYDAARAHLQAAVARLEQEGPPGTELIAALNALGNTDANLGRFVDARAELERATALVTQLFGPTHPNVGKGLNNLGYVAQQQHDYDAALDYYRRAVDLKTRALGLENATTARSIANVAITLSMQGHSDQALPLLQQAIAIFERTLGPEHPEVGTNLGNLGAILGQLGRADEGRAALDHALAIERKAYGPDHADLAEVHEAIAELELSAGRLDRALAAAGDALALRRRVLGEAHYLTGSSWALLGTVKGARKEYADALLDFETGRKILEQAEDADAPTVSQVLTEEALCLIELGRGAEAVPLAEHAAAIATSASMTDYHAGYAQLAVAEAHEAARSAPHADNRALASRALIALRASGPDAAPRVAEAEAWLKAHP